MLMLMVMLLGAATDDGPLFDPVRFRNLPDWARNPAEAIVLDEAPDGADVWRLLDETLLGFDDDGSLLVRRRIVQVVLHQGGAQEAGAYAETTNEDVGVVLRITGWHVPRRGTLQRVTQDDMVTLGMSRVGMIHQGTVTTAGFSFVGRGSVVAFESVKREKQYLGAVGFYPMLAPVPIKEFRLKLVEAGGSGEHVRLVARGCAPWGIEPQIRGNEIVARGLPAVENVPLVARRLTYYPFVTAQFLATEEDRARYRDWDHYARWYWGVFRDAALKDGAPEPGPVSADSLRAMTQPLRERVTYQQVYLSNARGYVPENGAEVLRRAYGDCKDMVSCFAYMGIREKVRVLPVLANIVDGADITAEDAPYPMFNHLIAAVPLTSSLGLAAEVVVGDRRYLIYDATSADTAFGFLPRDYQGRHVLICTPRGADWVAIPDHALEPGNTVFRLQGALDADGAFTGTLQVREQGNASGFRTLIRRYGRQVTDRVIRDGMPATARITAEDATVDAAGSVTAQWQVSWPGFLVAAGPGFHLPEKVLPRLPTSLRTAGRPREMPIFIDDQPAVVWELDLACAVPLTPVRTEASGGQMGRRWQWRAEAGARLTVRFESAFQQTAYPHDQTGAGVKAWHAFAGAYARFRREQSLLRPR